MRDVSGSPGQACVCVSPHGLEELIRHRPESRCRPISTLPLKPGHTVTTDQIHLLPTQAGLACGHRN